MWCQRLPALLLIEPVMIDIDVRIHDNLIFTLHFNRKMKKSFVSQDYFVHDYAVQVNVKML